MVTVTAVLVSGGEVHSILQQHGADGSQVLLGCEVQSRLSVFGQLVHLGPSQQLQQVHKIINEVSEQKA